MCLLVRQIAKATGNALHITIPQMSYSGIYYIAYKPLFYKISKTNQSIARCYVYIFLFLSVLCLVERKPFYMCSRTLTRSHVISALNIVINYRVCSAFCQIIDSGQLCVGMLFASGVGQHVVLCWYADLTLRTYLVKLLLSGNVHSSANMLRLTVCIIEMGMKQQSWIARIINFPNGIIQ